MSTIPQELIDKFHAAKREYQQYTSPFQWHDAKWYFFTDTGEFGPYPDQKAAQTACSNYWRWQAAMDAN